MATPSLRRISWIVVGSLLLAGGHVRGQPGEPNKPRVDLYGDPLPAGAIARLGTLRFRSADGFYMMGRSSLEWTPDGRFLVSGGARSAIIWDAATGSELRRLGDKQGQAFGPASLSPDGKLVAVGGWGDQPNKAGAVYELASGKWLYGFGKVSQHIYARFSPDGALLVTRGTDLEIQLLEATTGKLVHRLKGHEPKDGVGESVEETLFAPDGKTLISTGVDATIRFWDVMTGKQRKQIDVGGKPIRQMLLSADGKWLASISWVTVMQPGGGWASTLDRRVKIWDAVAGKKHLEILVPPEGEIDGFPRSAYLVCFMPDGGLLTAGGDRVMRVWDPQTGKELRHWHDDHQTGAIAFAPGGKKFAAIEGSWSISIRDSVTKQSLTGTDAHSRPVRALAISPDGNMVAAAEEFHSLLIWDRSTNKPAHRLSVPKERIDSMSFSPDGATLYSSHATYAESLLLFWDAKTGKELKAIKGDHERTSVMALSPDGKRIAWTGHKSQILLLDALSGAEVGKLKAPTAQIEQVSFTPDGSAILAWQMGVLRGANQLRDDHVIRWEIATGQRKDNPCQGLPDNAFAIVFSPDRRLIAFGGQQGDVMVADVGNGRELRRLSQNLNKPAQEGAVFCAAFSPDGRTLAWGGPIDGLVRLSEIASGKERRVLAGHASAYAAVRALSFTLDGKHLISGGADTTCLVWDLMGPAGWADDPPPPLNENALAECWEHLRSPDAAKAYLALRRLAADPIRAVPYLRQQLRPITAPDEKRVAGLVRDLDSEDFKVRDAAMRDLEKTGDVVLAALRKAAAGKPSLETRRRIEQLVDELDSMNQTRLRSIRAIEALEYIGSADAERVLQALAKGAPGAHQTREARESLERIRKR
jgi:WD40 repeat protein